jgi:hypothetical protein
MYTFRSNPPDDILGSKECSGRSVLFHNGVSRILSQTQLYFTWLVLALLFVSIPESHSWTAVAVTINKNNACVPQCYFNFVYR